MFMVRESETVVLVSDAPLTCSVSNHFLGKNIQGGMEIIPFNNNKHPTVPTKEQAENQKPIHYHGLLLTCRSFFHQTRHILCSKNTFVGLPNINNIRCGPTSALYNIESIVFNCRIEVREDDKKIDFIQNSLKKALDFCKPWAKVKTLKRLKLAFPHYEGDGTSSYAQFLNDAKERPLAPNTWLNYMFQEIDARYCRFVINRMCLVGKIFSNSVVKPQIYAFRYLCLTPGSRLPYPKEYDVRYATALMQELHLRLRMPLFVDGRLCYKEGIEYAKPFEVILP